MENTSLNIFYQLLICMTVSCMPSNLRSKLDISEKPKLWFKIHNDNSIEVMISLE